MITVRATYVERIRQLEDEVRAAWREVTCLKTLNRSLSDSLNDKCICFAKLAKSARYDNSDDERDVV